MPIIDQHFKKYIRNHTVLEAEPGSYVRFPEALAPPLKNILKSQGIEKLYEHQKLAYDSVSSGQDTLIVSQTASGKTLSFLLPVLDDHVKQSSPFSVLLLYPTKALSRDQENNLFSMLDSHNLGKKLGTYDGDTAREERSRLVKSADFILSNPDMLHGGILPNHNRKWKNFLSRLKYIIIDEVHVYRGSYGSHVANIFRRLLRVCEIHGSTPQFICSSATIGNPKEHVQALFQRDFNIVQKNSAPRPRRDLYLMNPSMVKSHGGTLYRKGPSSLSVPLLIKACKEGVRTICFCRGRQEVERIYKAVLDRDPGVKDLIKPYRGGLLPNERRKLEKDLFEGRLKAIISTNALELGIDIGNLDLCIISGHPGSLASFWQQAGRVGRKNNNASIAYIAKESPIDQYIVHHPDFLTDSPVEHAWLNANNPYILLQHVPCAAYEHPLRKEEPSFPEQLMNQCKEVLLENKTLKPYKEFLRYCLDDYPSKGVNIRGMTDHNILIYCEGEIIGEIDPIGARGELYKDAIYQHLGKKYLSLNLDLEQKLCHVKEVAVDYYTEASWEKRVQLIDTIESKELYGHKVSFGFINANKQPKLYKKIKERTFENVGSGPITLSPFEYDTTGFCIKPSPSWIDFMKKVDKRFPGAGLYGLSSILKKVSPHIYMGSNGDIETDVSLSTTEENEWKSALFLFDCIDGGVGYGEKVFENLEQTLELCLEIINECSCEMGCPACVPTLPPGIDDANMTQLMIESNASLECTKSLLHHLLYDVYKKPDICILKTRIDQEITVADIDQEFLKNQKRFENAAHIMKRKRERLH